jgi:hypothetical protein
VLVISFLTSPAVGTGTKYGLTRSAFTCFYSVAFKLLTSVIRLSTRLLTRLQVAGMALWERGRCPFAVYDFLLLHRGDIDCSEDFQFARGSLQCHFRLADVKGWAPNDNDSHEHVSYMFVQLLRLEKAVSLSHALRFRCVFRALHHARIKGGTYLYL